MRAPAEPTDRLEHARPPFPREAHDVQQTVVRACLRRHPKPEAVQGKVGDEQLADGQELGRAVAGDAESHPGETPCCPQRGTDRGADIGRVGRPVVRPRECVQADAYALDSPVIPRRARRRDEVEEARAPLRRELGGLTQVEGDAERAGDVIRAACGKDGELGRPERKIGRGVHRPVPTEEDDPPLSELRPLRGQLGQALRPVRLDPSAPPAQCPLRSLERLPGTPHAARASVRDEDHVATGRAPPECPLTGPEMRLLRTRRSWRYSFTF